MVAQMERVARDQEEIDRIAPTLTGGRGKVLNLTPVPGADRGVDDRARGEDRAGPPADRPGDLQPPGDGHAPPGRRHGAVRRAGVDAAAGRRPDRRERAAGAWTTRGTRTRATDSRRRRSPTRGGRRSRRRCTPHPTRARAARCAPTCPPTSACTSTTCSTTTPGNHSFTVTDAQFQADVQYAVDHNLLEN